MAERTKGPNSDTFGHRDATEQVRSNCMREGNEHLTPRGGSSCGRGGFASVRLLAPPMGQPKTSAPL